MSTTAVLDSVSVAERKPFTATLWLLWIAAAILDQSLHLAALARNARLLAHENTVDDAFVAGIQLVELYALIVPITATAQWLVLRRALPRLDGGLWLVAAGIGAVATFFIFLASAAASWSSSSTWLFACVASEAVAASIVSLFALCPDVARWPTAFVVASVVAAGVTAPLYAAAEFPFQVLPSRWFGYSLDAQAVLVVGVLLRLTAGAVGGAVTGAGLRLLCRPTAPM
jgi:hypothetical protein